MWVISQAKKSCSAAADEFVNTEAAPVLGSAVVVGGSSLLDGLDYDENNETLPPVGITLQAAYWHQAAAAHNYGLDRWLVARNE